MRNKKCYSILACSMLFILGLSTFLQAQTLLGQWTFDPGTELRDLAGNFGDIQLNGATIENGSLILDTDNWAATTDYTGTDITEKTMVAWLSMDDLDVTHGAPIAIQKISADSFDAITYAERQPRRFFPGSSNFSRTQDPVPGFEETETGVLFQLAISYENSDGEAHIMMYRNGDLIGEYTQGPIATWTAGDVEVIFGPRADFSGFGGAAYGWIACHVEEARLYGSILSQAQIEALTFGGTSSVTRSGKISIFWGKMKSK